MSNEKQIQYVSVLFPRPFKETYTYSVPSDFENINLGDFVLAPLGKGQEIGVVWDIQEKEPDLKIIKTLYKRFSIPGLSEAFRKLIDWIADYYFFPKGLVLKLALPLFEAISYEPIEEILFLEPFPQNVALTTQRQKLIDYLKYYPGSTLKKTLEETQISRSVLKSAIELQLVRIDQRPLQFLKETNYHYVSALLSQDQEKAAIFLKNKVLDNSFSVTLLDGVTGSGKTEVYFEAIAEALTKGKQALVLMPEIALTSQWLSRFEKRFGASPTLWHSSLTPKTRRENWRSVLEKKAKIVVGARSALFLPFPQLGLIIVDEEHEASYKQEEGVTYHARDVAVMRAKQENCALFLVSATPSLETLYNVKIGRYALQTLPSRFGGAHFPEVHLIDLRENTLPKGSFLSYPLLTAIAENLKKGEQTLLFMNRRGYAPLTLCQKCGFRLKCRQCVSWLVEHKRKQKLLCHYCGYSESIPIICPECQAEHSFIAYGPGIERIHEEIQKHFKNARIALMSSDHIKNWSEMQTLVQSLENREVDILIGTQMVTKGYHFPYLTLVGVIDGDSGLSGGDPRIAERTYQLLHQVGGRAGRELLKGKVYIQTFMPDQPLIKALVSGYRDEFTEIEFYTRSSWELPPFGRLAAIVISGRDQNEVIAFSQFLVQKAPIIEGVTILGPVEAPLFMVRGRYRQRVLLKMSLNLSVQKYLILWFEGLHIKKSLTIDIDIDPYNFL